MKSAYFWLISFLLFVAWLPLVAKETNPKGVIILTSASGLDPRNVLFTNLVWTDFYGGDVIDVDGQKTVFANKDIGTIVYFDSEFYSHLDTDQQFIAFRAGIQAKELLTNTNPWNLVSKDDLQSLQKAEATLEDVARRYSTAQPLIQPQINLLKDDINQYFKGQRMVAGTWMTRAQALAAQTPQVVGGGSATATFTTKDGKSYVNANVAITDQGVSVLTSDGGANVPFDKLPDDLSSFSPKLRTQIIARRTASTPESPHLPQTESLDATSRVTQTNTAVPIKPFVSQETIASQLLRDPFQLDWSRYEYEDALMKQIQDLCDKDLPDDVMTALSFIRSKVSSSSFIIVDSKGVLIQTQTVTPFIRTFARVVAIKDLNPSDIVQQSAQVKDFPGQYQTEYALQIYPTLRKPIIQCYPSTPDAEKVAEQAKGDYMPSHINAINITGLDETTDERIAKAFHDVIVHYGGREDPSLDEITTLNELRQFIEDKLNKSPFTGPVEDPYGPYDVSLDEKTGQLILRRSINTLGGLVKQQFTLNAKSLNPDDFTWSKTGDNVSTLTIYGKDIQREYAGKLLQAGDSLKLSCSNEDDAHEVAQAFQHICTQFGWKPSKY